MTVVEASPVLQHKNVPVSGIKVLDDEKGIVEAFVSGIGNKDSSGDIILPGAFDGSLARRTPKGVWSHDWARWVAKTLDIFEVKLGDPRLPVKMSSRGVGGLYVRMQFNLATQDGREAFENVKFFGDEAEWSIGYMEIETEYSKELLANLLKEIDLYEYSPVLFGANNLTSTVSVKVDHVDDQYQILVSGLGNKDLEAQVSKAVQDALTGAESKKEDEVTVADTAVEAAPEEKVVPGSMEARYSALCEALSEAHPDGYTWPVATFTDSVVYEVMSFGGDPDDSGTFQRSYAIDESGSITFGEPKAVDVVEVIVEKSGGIEALEAKGGSLEALKAVVAEGQKSLFEGLVEKAGRVLSVKNQDRLSQAKGLIDEVLSSGEKTPEEDVKDGDEKEIEVEISSTEAVEVPEEKTAEDEPFDIKAALVTIDALREQIVKHLGGEDVEVKAEEKDANEDPDDSATHHMYVKGDSGMCKICGEPESSDVHSKMTGDDEDDEGAGDEQEKSEEVEIDGADLLASLSAELDLVDSFLPAS